MSSTNNNGGFTHWRQIFQERANRIRTPEQALPTVRFFQECVGNDKRRFIRRNANDYERRTRKNVGLRMMRQYRNYNDDFQVIVVPIPEQNGAWCPIPMWLAYELLDKWANDYVSRENGYVLGSDRNIRKLQIVAREHPELAARINTLIIQLRARRRTNNNAGGTGL